MAMRKLLGALARVVLSLLFAGVFYLGWMAAAILTIRSGFGGLTAKVVLWILAPVVTGLGFAVGATVFELLSMTEKGRFWRTYKWCLAGCALGGGVVCLFGPMLIVFGMLAAGTLSVVLCDVNRGRKK